MIERGAGVRYNIRKSVNEGEIVLKYMVYIVTTVLAAAAFFMGLPDLTLFQAAFTGTGFYVVLFVFAIIQLFKPLPRLMLLADGVACTIACVMLAAGIWTSLIAMAAGLLSAGYEWSRYGRMVKAQPVRRIENRKLVASGVFACVAAAYLWLTALAAVFAGYGAVTQWLPQTVGGVCFAGMGVFCFLKNRRTSVLYRMFFAGLPLLNVFSAFGAGTALNVSGGAAAVALAFYLLVLASVAMVLTDAVRTRGEMETMGDETEQTEHI